MTDQSTTEELRELAKLHLGWKPEEDLLDFGEPPFDVTKPNIHDSKKDFLLERDTVREIIKHLEAVFRLLYKPEDDETPEHHEMVDRLSFAIETKAKENRSGGRSRTAVDIALKNVVDAGFHHTSILVLLDMLSAYRQRLFELNEQEKEFWTVSNRPPNYYARTIALRFARFYARQTRTRPTYGASSDGAHPSTQYGRLLVKFFRSWRLMPIFVVRPSGPYLK